MGYVLIYGLLAVHEPGSGTTGTELTQDALDVHISAAGTYFVTIAIFFFAFTSIIGNNCGAGDGRVGRKPDRCDRIQYR